ncbi:hypothetical protein IX84_20060 [Phaeodactylibacter xiamenensis]|uniref:Uncharacterized protein n=1 Tax=Phaeodactylibacter xiamenensis TaxID=1524460 RepID=A0A098S3Q4_9BACT|nr:hypothetical protein IX84_20060 [Phaeodactylibacter xiamenensis]
MQPIRAFGNVKVASVVVGAVLGRASLVGVALFFVTEKLESPPPTPARMGMVLCCLLVYSGGPAFALALAGRARAVPLVRSWGEQCWSVGRQEAVAKRPLPWVTLAGPSPSDVA